MSENALNMDQLGNYLNQHLPDWVGQGWAGDRTNQTFQAEKFAGGQSNPTYLLTNTAGQKLVLRRKPSGVLLASAHAVDREFKVMQALHQAQFPVARPLVLCQDDAVIGTAFYIMEYLPGRIFWNPALPELAPSERALYYREIARVLGQLHGLDVTQLGLLDYGKPGNYFARQLKRWSEQYRASQTEELPAMEQLISKLTETLPADDGQVALVHGDFRIDNLMFHPTEPKIIAVMDWELSTLGHPMADASYFCMALRLPNNPTLPGLAGQNRAELGIPEEAQWLADYQNHHVSNAQPASSASTRSEFPYYLAFNFFRLAAIAQGVKKRALQGNASNAKAEQVGQMVPFLAGLGLSSI